MTAEPTGGLADFAAVLERLADVFEGLSPEERRVALTELAAFCGRAWEVTWSRQRRGEP